MKKVGYLLIPILLLAFMITLSYRSVCRKISPESIKIIKKKECVITEENGGDLYKEQYLSDSSVIENISKKNTTKIKQNKANINFADEKKEEKEKHESVIATDTKASAKMGDNTKEKEKRKEEEEKERKERKMSDINDLIKLST